MSFRARGSEVGQVSDLPFHALNVRGRVKHPPYRRRSHRQITAVVFAILALSASLSAQPATATPAPAAADAAAKPPSPPYLSPEESAKLVQLPPGYRLELVLSEPDIREPVVSVFDGNGRLYVAEMRTYMQDADAKDEKAATSRVSLHWSSKGDGHFDRHSVFVDNLLLPRMVLPLKDSVLIQETDTGDVYEYRDTNGDGVSDEKKLFFSFEPRSGQNLEHQPSGLIWAQDNWIYSTYNAVRIRWTPNGVVKEPTAPNGGQWGLAQDNYGKTFVVNAGNENGPSNFQQPVVYGAFKLRDEMSADFREVFPLVGLADVQGGTSRFRPTDQTLNHTTSAAGVEIVRGDRLPADFAGDMLFGEPVGRLIRRAKIEAKDGVTRLRNASEKSEFLRSTDPFFRPVNLVNAPDGTIYITDMYRGIIQEGNWTRKGAYLRTVIDRYGMADKIGGGRIWRLVHDSMKPGPQPHLLDEQPAQLVAYLAHPNGWWRDTAQKLIILSQDKSVAPALRNLARASVNPLARIHALWTLEGLGVLDADLVREKFRDPDTHVRVAAIRASETLIKAGDTTLGVDVLAQCRDPNADIAIQGMLTANLLKLPDAAALITKSAQSSAVASVKDIASQILNPIGGSIGAQFTGAQRQQLERGQGIYLELCYACHGIDGKGTPIEGRNATLAPPLADSATTTGHRDAILMALLHGVSGPINGKTYEAPMAPMGGNDDAWVAAIASYVRTSFGNQSPLVSLEDAARVRKANATRKEAWTLPDLNARLPQPVANRDAWKLTTNRPADTIDTGTAPAKFSFNVKAPVAGAWLQIELPTATTLSEIRLRSVSAPKNYTRAYRIEFSADGENWGEPIASGRGLGPITDISFTPAKTKWIRITQTQPQFGFGRGGNAGGAGGAPGRGPAADNAAPANLPARGPAPGPAAARGGFGPGPAPTDWTLDDVQLLQPASNSLPASQ